MSTRSRRERKRRRKTTMPAKATPTRTRKPKSLRSALTRLLRPGSGPRLAVAVAGRPGCTQAALQVVEDEPGGRLRPGDGGGGAVALEDDEDTAVERRRLHLGELPLPARAPSLAQ